MAVAVANLIVGLCGVHADIWWEGGRRKKMEEEH